MNSATLGVVTGHSMQEVVVVYVDLTSPANTAYSYFILRYVSYTYVLMKCMHIMHIHSIPMNINTYCLLILRTPLKLTYVPRDLTRNVGVAETIITPY